MYRKRRYKRKLEGIGKNEFGFDVGLEKDIYCYLCCIPMRKGRIKKLTEKQKFTSYQKWKQYVSGKYETYSRDCLIEFSRYLTQRIRNIKPVREAWAILFSSIIGFLFSDIIGKMADDDFSFLKASNVISLLAIIIILAISIFSLILIVRELVMPIFDNDIEENMFTDYKEIIDEMIKERDKKSRKNKKKSAK